MEYGEKGEIWSDFWRSKRLSGDTAAALADLFNMAKVPRQVLKLRENPTRSHPRALHFFCFKHKRIQICTTFKKWQYKYAFTFPKLQIWCQFSHNGPSVLLSSCYKFSSLYLNHCTTQITFMIFHDQIKLG